MQGFENSALDWLVAAKLTPEQRRHLLSRLQRPDYPNLVKLIVDDLNFTNSGGFGQFEIHRRLLLVATRRMPEAHARPAEPAELRECLSGAAAALGRRELAARPRGAAGLSRAAVGFRQDARPAAHNSLKAHVLYHRLVLDRSQGKYDLERFLEYLKLPKNVVYIPPKFMEPIERQQQAANLQQDFSGVTLLPLVGDDEPLVRSYLAHFLLDADDYKVFAPYINDQYLNSVCRSQDRQRPGRRRKAVIRMLPPGASTSNSKSGSISILPTRTRPNWRPTTRWRSICMSRMSTR